MLNLRRLFGVALLFGLLLTAGLATAQTQDNNYESGYDDDYQNRVDDYQPANRASIDRYLDVEVWTDHADADYYAGDDVRIYFRSNRDAFIAIYSVDSRGMVNLIFPAGPADDNFVRGGVSYSMPGPDDDFELIVNGPEGTETIQIVASQERFPIPAWHNNSGLIFEGDDIYDYMDYLNNNYFVRYDGQRFAYDRAVFFVNEWEPDYFRPVYYPSYPSWSVVGNVYIDYAWGSSVYVNGYYWGVTPLYIPRILVGWHTMTIYDPWGYCWENDFHVGRHYTSVFDSRVIITSASIRSKYKTVREVGYRDPISHGYPQFSKTVSKRQAALGLSPKVVKSVRGSNQTIKNKTTQYVTGSKKYRRGDAKIVRTDRGFETRTETASKSSRSTSGTNKRSYDTGRKSSKGDRSTDSYSGSDQSSRKGRTTSSSGSSGSGRTIKPSKSSGSSTGDYYKKKSGSSSSRTSKTQKSRTIKSKSQGSSKSTKSSSSGKVKQPKSTKSQSGSSKATKKSTESRVNQKQSSQPASQSKAVQKSSQGSSSKSSSKSSSSSGKGKKRR